MAYKRHLKLAHEVLGKKSIHESIKKALLVITLIVKAEKMRRRCGLKVGRRVASQLRLRLLRAAVKQKIYTYSIL